MIQKDYKINLIFGADTSLAIQNIQKLGQLLNTLTTRTPVGFETGSIKSAISDIQQLQIHLQNAVNINTGKLDLGKFNRSLKMSKTSLSQYSASLLSLGPQGQQAFARLATAISQAEVPMYRLSARTKEFMTTLGNTVKWQIASSAIHGVTGALSESIRYIEKFDKALTDIKIVSNLNDKQLLSFSKHTREIAKEINATALEIAQGSTIYFQQGLNEEQVAERIAVTTKMANITGETTEKISSQLTAIWNNFDNGTKSLESYADTLAYLGAKTAADTNQIATAMEKFAASAKTVGLSYNYAAAAVAEVIDRTQMAPEEVGTAFKTILSRMQGLKLGETLEDGVELNKYAEALDVIGVKVLDANGSLREADTILKDLGEKWNDLDAGQKKALATTVAGVRQQTQFIALMEEWNDIETSVSNLAESTGYLTQANNKYADSVAGVKKQFENVKSEFFKKLFGDDYANDFIKDFYKSMIDLIEQVDRFIDAFGGLKPMLITFGMLFAKNLMPSVLDFTRNSIANLATLFGFTESQTKKLQSEFAKIAQQNLSNGVIDPAMEKQLIIAQELVTTKHRLQALVKNQGQFEKDVVNYQIEQFEQASAVLQKELERQHSLEKQVQLQKDLVVSQSRNELGTSAAVNAYRSSSTDSAEYQNEVVDIATNFSVADIDKQIAAIQASKQEAVSTEMDKLLSRKAALDENRGTVSKAIKDGEKNIPNMPTKTEVQRQDKSAEEQLQIQRREALKKIEQDIAEIDAEIARLGDENNQNADEEIQKLEAAKKLRQDIQNARREFNSSTIVSQDTDEIYGTPSEQEGGKGARQLGNEIVTGALPNGGITATYDEGADQTNITMQTSIDNAEALIKKRAELTSTTQNLSSMEKDLDSSLKKTIAELKKNASSGKSNATALEEAKKSAMAYTKEIAKMVKTLAKGKQGKAILKELGNAMSQIMKAEGPKDFEAGFNNIIKVLQKVKNGAKDAGITVDGAIDQMLLSLKESGASAQQLDILEAQLKELGLWTQDTANKFAKLRGELQNSSGPAMNFGAMMGSAISKIGSFAGSLQMAISGLNMLKSAFTEANSPGEALMNYLMGLSMVLPVVAAGFNLLGLSKKKETAETKKSSIATLADIGIKKIEAAQANASAGANLFLAGVKALLSAISNFGWVGVGIGLVAMAAIAGAAIAFNAGSQKQEEEKEEADVEKTMEAVSNQFNKAREEADKLKESIKGFKDSAKDLEGLDKSTQEYADALEEANNKAKDLIKTHGLYGKFRYNKDGLIEFDQGVLEDLEKKSEAKAQEAESNKNYQEIAYEKEKLDLEYEKTAEGIVLSTEDKKKIVEVFANAGKDFGTMSEAEVEEFIRNSTELSDNIKLNAQAIGQQKDAFETLTTKSNETAEAIENIAKAERERRIKAQYGDLIEEASNGDQGMEEIIAAGMANVIENSNIPTKEEYITQDAWFDTSDINMNSELQGVGIAENDQRFSEVTNDADVAQAYAHYILGYDWKTIEKMKYDRGNGKGTLTLDGEAIEGLDEKNDEAMRIELTNDWVRDQYAKEWEQKYGGKEEEAAENFAKIAGQISNTDIGRVVLQNVASGKKEGLDLTQLSNETYGSLEELYNSTNEDILEHFGYTEEKLKALGYNSGKEFIANFKKGFEDLGGAEKFYEAQKNQIIQEGATAYELDPEVVEAQAKQIEKALKESNEELDNASVIAAKVAVANQRMNKGVETLSKSWKDWKKVLNGTNKETQDYAEALVGAEKAMKEILGLSDDAIIPEGFLESQENLELLDQIANGSEEAKDQLGFNLAEAQVTSLKFSQEIQDNLNSLFDPRALSAMAGENGIVDVFNKIKTNALDAIQGIQTAFDGLQPGATLTGDKAAKFANSLNEYAKMTGMSVTQMQNMLNEMEVHAEVTTTEEDIVSQVPQQKTVRTISDQDYDDKGQLIGYTMTDTTSIVDYVPVPEKIQIAQINTDKPVTFTKIDSGSISPSTTTGGGGGGKKRPAKPTKVKPTDKKKKVDEVERYHEINKELEDYQDSLDRISNLKDEAWGPDKIKAMEAEKQELKNLIASHKKYQKQIATYENGELTGGYLKEGREAAKKAGAIFDENGNISNYEELQEQWMNEWNAQMAEFDRQERELEDRLAAAKNAEDEDAQEKIQEEKDDLTEARQKYDDFHQDRQDDLDRYEDTLKLEKDAKKEEEEYYRQMREKNFEQLEYSLEIKVEFNEDSISDLEHALERLGEDDIAHTAERLVYIQQMAVNYGNIADEQMASLKEAERLYQLYLSGDQENGISYEDYMARIKDAKEALQEAEMSIRDGIAQIGDELENAFDLADEKLDKQYTKFERLDELMEHYKSVVSLTEGEESYASFNKILQAQQKILKDRIATEKEEVEMWKNRREQLEADINSGSLTGEALERAEKSLDYIIEKESEANSQLMSDIVALGEITKEVFENSINDIMKTFNEELFAGIEDGVIKSVDNMVEAIERLNSRQENILTTTNKMYETNKLIRDIEKQMEVTTNKRAKQAFNEFNNKVKQKQEQNKLTKFELDLLTAEYEITKAQIALEEAQEAKDQVRLVRDAEGNYGYVYTANEDKKAEAEQNLDDAKNNYYNLSLESMIEAQDEAYSIMADWEEEIKNAAMDENLTEEQKRKKIAEIDAHYTELMLQALNRYNLAKAALEESSYQHELDYDFKGIESAQNWMENKEDCIAEIESELKDYDVAMNEVSQHTVDNYGDMETGIQNVVTKSEEFRNETEDLIPTLEEDLTDAIDTATEAWWRQVEALQEVMALTNDVMKQNHDTQLKELYKEDYAAEIMKRLANGASYGDYDIQQLLEFRWDKMGGVDNTDYKALIDAGGTPEQIAFWEAARRFKIEKTDWASSNESYADEMRAEKLDENFAQLIIDYYRSSPNARWTDERVQDRLRAREAKIKEMGPAIDTDVKTEAELKAFVAKKLGRKPEALKTGGYTGEWGPEGRLAFLHQKELVLNAHDTENFLTATEMLRDINKWLEERTIASMLDTYRMNLTQLQAPADQILQQEVTIHAEFPNVSEHNEIEEALSSLMNRASQYAFQDLRKEKLQNN